MLFEFLVVSVSIVLCVQPDEPMQVDAVGGEAPSSPMQMQLMSFTVENPTLVSRTL